jgi:hypothetical protein
MPENTPQLSDEEMMVVALLLINFDRIIAQLVFAEISRLTSQMIIELLTQPANTRTALVPAVPHAVVRRELYYMRRRRLGAIFS